MSAREPLPPPFPVGTRLRYRGNHAAYDGKTKAPLVEPGMVVTIVRVRDGWPGTGRVIDYDENGEAICDDAHDGYSVYEAPGVSRVNAGRAIFPDLRDEWEVLS